MSIRPPATHSPIQGQARPYSSWSFSPIDRLISYGDDTHNDRSHREETSITMSSAASWPDEDENPQPPPNFNSSKRPRSPFENNRSPNKRQREYNSPGRMPPSRSERAQSFFDECEDEHGGYGQRYSHNQGDSVGLGIFVPDSGNNLHTGRPVQREIMQQTSSPIQNTYSVTVPPNYRSRRVLYPAYGAETSSSPYKHPPTPRQSFRGQGTSTTSPSQLRVMHNQSPGRSQRVPDNQFRRAQSMAPEHDRQYQDRQVERGRYISDAQHGQPQLGSPLYQNARSSSVFFSDDRNGPNTPGYTGRFLPHIAQTYTPPNQTVRPRLEERPQPIRPSASRQLEQYAPLRAQGFEQRGGEMCYPANEEPTRQRSRSILGTPVDQHSGGRKNQPTPRTLRQSRAQSMAPLTPSRAPSQPPDRRIIQPSTGHQEHDSDDGEQTPLEHLIRRNMGRPVRTYEDRVTSTHVMSRTTERVSSWVENTETDKETGMPKVNKRGSGKSDDPFDLCTPENSAKKTPLLCSVPMKDRLGPSQLRVETPKKETTVREKTPKSSRKVNPAVQTQKLNPEVAKQQRIARNIIQAELRAETEGLEEAIFGEVLTDTPAEVARKKELRLLELEAERIERDKKWATEERQAREAEEAKKRLDEYNAEQQRRLKQQQEKKKREKLETERKKQAQLDIAALDEKRRKAQERIVADRQKEQADRDAKALERDRLATVQADRLRVEELKLKQEAAKLQAQSLRASSIFPPDVKNNGASEAPEEELLFLAESEIYDVDDRAEVRHSGITNAAELFAHSEGPWRGRKSFQQTRDEFLEQKRAEERQLQLTKCRNRMAQRYHTDASPPTHETAHKKSTTAKKPKPSPIRPPKAPKPRTKPDSAKGRDIPIEARIGSRASASASLSPTLADMMNDPSSQQSPARLPKSKNLPAPRPPPQKGYTSQLKTYDEAERESKLAEKQKREEEVREARRKKEADKARNKYIAVTTNDAKRLGKTISGEALNYMTELHMMKREEKLSRKRASSIAPSSIFTSFKSSNASFKQQETVVGESPASQSQPRTYSKECADCKRRKLCCSHQPTPSEVSTARSPSPTLLALPAPPVKKGFSKLFPLVMDTAERTTDLATHKQAMIAAATPPPTARGSRIAPRMTVDDLPKMPIQQDEDPDSNSDSDDSDVSEESEEGGDDEDEVERYRQAQKRGQELAKASQVAQATQPPQPTQIAQSRDDNGDGDDMIKLLRNAQPKDQETTDPAKPAVNEAENVAVEFETQFLATLDAAEENKQTSTSLNPDDFDSQIVEPLADMTVNFGGATMNEAQETTSQAPAAEQVQPSSPTPQSGSSVAHNRLIRVYFVKHVSTTDNEHDDDPVELAKFIDRTEANDLATSAAKEYHQQLGEPRKVEEEFKHHLYHCKLSHNDRNATLFFVETRLVQDSMFVNLNTSKVKPVYNGERTWVVHLKLVKKIIEDGETIKERTCEQHPDTYTDLGLANHAASMFLYEYTKPKNGNFEDAKMHREEIGPQCVNARDNFDADNKCFDVEIDRADEGIPTWMNKEITSIQVFVREQILTGPRN